VRTAAIKYVIAEAEGGGGRLEQHVCLWQAEERQYKGVRRQRSVRHGRKEYSLQGAGGRYVLSTAGRRVDARVRR
jgi:hypothetical protein